MTMADTLLDAQQVLEWTGWTKGTLYRLMQQGLFPRPIATSPRTVRWRESDLQQWLDSRPQGGGGGFEEVVSATS